MAGFDRIKPPEKRIPERQAGRRPDAPEADREGRAAVFRPPTDPEPPAPVAGDRVAPPPSREPRRRRPDIDVASAAHVDEDGTGDLDDLAGDQASDLGADDLGEPVTIDPPRRRARPEDPADPEQAAREARVPTGRSVLQVECSHCGITAPMPLGAAVRRALPLALVVPTRSHPVFATCPCGERRTWLRPSVGMPR